MTCLFRPLNLVFAPQDVEVLNQFATGKKKGEFPHPMNMPRLSSNGMVRLLSNWGWQFVGIVTSSVSTRK
jgi:hypothetical protein